MKYQLTCQLCGCSFVSNNHKTQKFCSRRCYNRFMFKPKAPKPEPLMRQCAWCKKNFTPIFRHHIFCQDCNGQKCCQTLKSIKKRLSRLYDGIKLTSELEKLANKGHGYRFPKPYTSLNAYYFNDGDGQND